MPYTGPYTFTARVRKINSIFTTFRIIRREDYMKGIDITLHGLSWSDIERIRAHFPDKIAPPQVPAREVLPLSDVAGHVSEKRFTSAEIASWSKDERDAYIQEGWITARLA